MAIFPPREKKFALTLPQADKDVKEINREIGVTPAQAEAMKVGSMFGWNVPGADPKSYDEKGKPIPPRSGGER